MAQANPLKTPDSGELPKLSSQCQLDEDAFWNVLDDEHDEAPEARGVNHRAAPIDRAHNVFGNLIGLRPQGPF